MRERGLGAYRAPALAFAVFLVVQAASAGALFALKLGGDVEGVRAFYLGAEERFTGPKSLAGMLEVAVPHLLAIPLVLFAALHVLGFARALRPRLFVVLVWLAFGSGLVGIVASFGVRWVAPGLAWAKVLAFVGLEGALLACAVLLVAVFASSEAASPAVGAAEPRRRQDVA